MQYFVLPCYVTLTFAPNDLDDVSYTKFVDPTNIPIFSFLWLSVPEL